MLRDGATVARGAVEGWDGKLALPLLQAYGRER